MKVTKPPGVTNREEWRAWDGLSAHACYTTFKRGQVALLEGIFIVLRVYNLARGAGKEDVKCFKNIHAQNSPYSEGWRPLERGKIFGD